MTLVPSPGPDTAVRREAVGNTGVFEAWMRAGLNGIERALSSNLPPATGTPERLHDALRYAVLGGGKRIRPLLCRAAGALVDVPEETLNAAGAAIEMIHAYSLVHDDLPAMDNDALRRGRPTVHVQYDEATAILVGDALQAQAFQVLSKLPLPAERRVDLIHELAVAAGSQNLVGGQSIDLQSVGVKLEVAELERMHCMKTGALIRASVRIGALCAVAEASEPDLYDALDGFSAAIGLGFQVVDDILDVTADIATLGKSVGKDAQADKPTYVSILGLDAARVLAHDLREQAHAALEPLGARASMLGHLADLIVRRVH